MPAEPRLNHEALAQPGPGDTARWVSTADLASPTTPAQRRGCHRACRADQAMAASEGGQRKGLDETSCPGESLSRGTHANAVPRSHVHSRSQTVRTHAAPPGQRDDDRAHQHPAQPAATEPGQYFPCRLRPSPPSTAVPGQGPGNQGGVRPEAPRRCGWSWSLLGSHSWPTVPSLTPGGQSHHRFQQGPEHSPTPQLTRGDQAF